MKADVIIGLISYSVEVQLQCKAGVQSQAEMMKSE